MLLEELGRPFDALANDPVWLGCLVEEVARAVEEVVSEADPCAGLLALAGTVQARRGVHDLEEEAKDFEDMDAGAKDEGNFEKPVATLDRACAPWFMTSGLSAEVWTLSSAAKIAKFVP